MTQSNNSAPRVLYVEDDANLRYTLCKMLEFLGYQVNSAENGRDGVEKAKSWQPDVILMDIRMPVMDGIEAIGVLRSDPDTAGIPIFMLSAFTDAKTRQACEAADGFFTKPPNMQKIDVTIRKILNSKGG